MAGSSGKKRKRPSSCPPKPEPSLPAPRKDPPTELQPVPSAAAAAAPTAIPPKDSTAAAFLASLNEQDQDALSAQQLRFHFLEYDMKSVLMQRSLNAAGITYTYPGYRHKQLGFEFENAVALQYALDQFSLPEVTNRLELPPTQSATIMAAAGELTDEKRQQLLELRNQVLLHSFRLEKLTAHRGSSSTSSSDEERPARILAPTSSLTSSSQDATNGKKRRISTRPKSTVTDFEAGASLILQQGKKQVISKRLKKQQQQQQQRNANSSSSSEATPDSVVLDFPTPQQCIDHFEEQFDMSVSKKELDKDTKKSALKEQLERVESKYKEQYKEWKFLLSTQHSILLYGIGSKRHVLNDFGAYVKDKGDFLTIDGFHRDVTIDGIFDLLVSNFLDGKEPTSESPATMRRMSAVPGPHQQQQRIGISVTRASSCTTAIVKRATLIGQALAVKAKDRRQPLYFILHNIDGQGLQSRVVQDAIAALVVNSTMAHGVAGVRLIASVDHVNAISLLWSNTTQSNLAMIWKQVNTYRPYLEEIKYGLVQDKRRTTKTRQVHKAARDVENFFNVLVGLSPRHTDVLRVLASLQLKLSDDKSFIPRQKLFDMCKHECILSSDTDLQGFLTELIDHGMVEKNTRKNVEWLRIPADNARLHEILSYQRS